MGNCCLGGSDKQDTVEPPREEEKVEELKTQYKVLMIGDSSVGKSSLLLRFTSDEYTDAIMPTLGIDFKITYLEVAGKRVQLQIWDTAGQERYRTITRAYYRDAKGIMICFDVTNIDSFHSISRWFDESNSYAGAHVPKILVGTKGDLAEKRKVSTKEAQQLAHNLGLEYLETSAKSKSNIFHSFQCLSNLIAAV